MAFRFSLLFPLVFVVGCSNQVVVGSGGASSANSGAASGTPTTAVTTSSVTTSSITTSSVTTSSTAGGSQPPPPPPGAPPCDGSAPIVIAVNKLFIGTTDRMGNVSSAAWKGYGFDVDHQITTTSFSMHCQPNSNASPSQVFPDAPGGV